MQIMMMTLKEKIIFSVNKFIEEFQKNPFSYLYESDIQCALFSELRRNIDQKLTVGINNKNNRSYVMDLINSEYYSWKTKNRIDLVCLDPNEFKKQLKKKVIKQDNIIYGMPILVGIELKYLIMDCYGRTGVNILFDDLKKLNECKNVANKLVLGFVQDHDLAKSFLEDANKYGIYLGQENVDNLRGIYIITSEMIFYKDCVS